MGAGGNKGSMREIDDTQGSARDDRFQEIVAKIRKIANDFSEQDHPLYVTFGNEEAEIGIETIIKFNINRFDYELVRQVKDFRLSGEGHQKSLEPNMPPQVIYKLRKKEELGNDWRGIDLDDLF